MFDIPYIRINIHIFKERNVILTKIVGGNSELQHEYIQSLCF